MKLTLTCYGTGTKAYQDEAVVKAFTDLAAAHGNLWINFKKCSIQLSLPPIACGLRQQPNHHRNDQRDGATVD